MLRGIGWLNGVDVPHFKLPACYCTGRKARDCSCRLMMGFAPEDYRSAFAGVDAPVLLLAGTDDEAFRPDWYGPAITPRNAAVDIEWLYGVSYLGLVMRERTATRTARWLGQSVDR